MKNLYLIGMMGAGKTTVGRIAAKKTHCRFIDTDAVIAEKAGKTVEAIFEDEGEDGFRERETAVLRAIAAEKNRIVACGGGVVEREENIDLLRKSGTVIWLKRDLEATLSHPRVRRRPLLRKDVRAIYPLMQRRAPLYERACHHIVENDGDLARVVGRVLFFTKRQDKKGK